MSDVILDLTLRTAATPAVGLDLDEHLGELCTALVRALRVTGVAVVVLDPAGVHGSDPAAVLIGEAQRGTPVGPVASALRSGRTMLTPDLTRIGPPALAAAAADCGLVGSGVVPLRALDRPVGAVQLLGGPGWPIKDSHLDQLEPLLPVLAATLLDVAALAAAARGPRVADRAVTDRADTERVPVVPTPRRPPPAPRSAPAPSSPGQPPPAQPPPPPRPWSIFDTAEQDEQPRRSREPDGQVL